MTGLTFHFLNPAIDYLVVLLLAHVSQSLLCFPDLCCPAMEPSPAPSTLQGAPAIMPASKPPRILACVLCQHRKIKCDRHFPCANCTKVSASILTMLWLLSCVGENSLTMPRQMSSVLQAPRRRRASDADQTRTSRSV